MRSTMLIPCALSILLLAPGCAPAPSSGEATAATPPTIITASSETTKALSVRQWQITDDVDGKFVVALGESGERLATILVHQTGDDSPVRLTVEASGGTEELNITRDGNVSPAASPQASAWANALYRDSQQIEEHAPKAEPRSSVQPEAINPWTINFEQVYDVSGGLFGTRQNITVGRGCDNGFTRTQYSTTVINGSMSCWVNGWQTSDPYDCRVNLHLGESAFNWGECLLVVYQNGVTQ